MEIGVTNAGCYNFDQYLTRSRRRNLHLLDSQGLPKLPHGSSTSPMAAMSAAIFSVLAINNSTTTPLSTIGGKVALNIGG
jgi:hypothetical protein